MALPRDPLQRLARLEPAPANVVSVYLNTEWVDEHQRERVRVFLKNRLREAREVGGADPADLDWIEEQGRALVDRVVFADANGVALFAGAATGLRELLPTWRAMSKAVTPPAGGRRSRSPATSDNIQGEAIVARVVTSGGAVTTVERHAGLAGHGGVVARLRYSEGGQS
jgi:hypothetical protein